MTHPIFLKRVILTNYKSIAKCSVELGPLNFLVGPNGAGKSNFLDALRLVTESLNTSLDHALRERGGINEVRRRSAGHPTHFGIRLEFYLFDGSTGVYAFRVGTKEKGGFEVQHEECKISGESFFKVVSGNVVRAHMSSTMPPASRAMGSRLHSRDRLYLVAAAGLPDFRPLYDALSHMGFYNLNPDEIRELQQPDTGEVLRRDGGNLASVLSFMAKENEPSRKRIEEFLSKVVPGVQNVTAKHVGKKETLEFRQLVGRNKDAENMSDGTLRVLGVLTALFQSANGISQKVPLVGFPKKFHLSESRSRKWQCIRPPQGCSGMPCVLPQ